MNDTDEEKVVTVRRIVNDFYNNPIEGEPGHNRQLDPIMVIDHIAQVVEGVDFDD